MPTVIQAQKKAPCPSLLEISREMRENTLEEKKLKYGFDFSKCEPLDFSKIDNEDKENNFQNSQI